MKAPAGGAGRLVVRVGEGRVHVAEHGVARIAALLLDDVEHLVPEPEPAGQMHHQRQPVRACARAAPRSDFSSSAVKSDETPISPIRPMRDTVDAVRPPRRTISSAIGVDRHRRQLSADASSAR